VPLSDRTRVAASAPGIYIAEGWSRRIVMKYLAAWALGVPGIIIVFWMLANAAC